MICAIVCVCARNALRGPALEMTMARLLSAGGGSFAGKSSVSSLALAMVASNAVEHAPARLVLAHRQMNRLGAEIVRERKRARLAVAEHRNVVLHADDDLVGRERDVVARLGRTQPVDRLHRFHLLPDLLPHDLHRLLEERDDAARHRRVGDFLAVVHDLGLDLEGHFNLRHGPERRRHLRAVERQREREHARGEGVHLNGDERLRRASEFADELDVGVVRLRVGRLEAFALLEHRIQRRGDFVRPVLDAEQLRDAIVPAQKVGAAKVGRQMQRLEFIHRRLRLTARAAGADAPHRGRHGQHALMPAVEGERCLDEPAFKPPMPELLELPHADEGNRPEFVRVNGDRPRPFGIRPRRLHDPRSRRGIFHRVDDARTLRRGFERIGVRVEVDVRRVRVADPELECPRGRCREHAADTGPQRPHAKITLANVAALAAFVSPQRAAQLVAEHERRKRHRAAIAGDELARDEVGVEIEIAHAPARVSEVWAARVKPKPHMQKVTPFLSFDGQAEEAARFYVSLLPDSRIDRVIRSPMDTGGGPAGTVLMVEFTLAGTQYVALNAPQFSFTEAVSFMIACADQAETDRLWTALTADGGSELGCGWLKDRWGVTWQVTPTRLLELVTGPDRDRAARALASIGKMGKINIAEVERAADGV